MEKFKKYMLLGLIFAITLGSVSALENGQKSVEERLEILRTVFFKRSLENAGLAILFVILQLPRNLWRSRRIAERRRSMVQGLIAAARGAEPNPISVPPGQCQCCQSEPLVDGEALGPACLELIDMGFQFQQINVLDDESD